MPADDIQVRFGECYARLTGDELILGNAHVERRWHVANGLLYPASLRDRATGREWLANPATHPAPYPDAPVPDEAREVSFSARGGTFGPVEAPSLVAEVVSAGASVALTWRFQVFEGARGVVGQLAVARAGGDAGSAADAGAGEGAPSGIETAPAKPAAALPTLDAMEHFALAPRHLRLTQVILKDQTDIRNELVFENEWLLQPNEANLPLEGNLFLIEDTLTRDGLILLKHAPLPHARPIPNAVDLRANGRDSAFHLFGHGIEPEGGDGYRFVTLLYSGGRAGRIAALQEYQRQLRVYQPARDGLLVSNTWGDRSQDSRINQVFMRQEVEAGARLGVDVVQIDDGWQAGRTSNSVTKGGRWEGYWSAGFDFWAPHAERFPEGLAPVIALARERGMQFGLWFSPDSADDFANWERDASRLLELHREHGVNYFKIDGVKVRSKQGERNLGRFFERVLRESEGRVTFDLDVTAAVRPGYFSLMEIGPLFVENRYTDWRRYYPHQTLRNLWKLAHYIDPLRLRMEFLNHWRNLCLYQGDPLAPDTYQADYVFATVMCSSPLAWFEVSNLPRNLRKEMASLVSIWKAHRPAFHGGQLFPIGETPDGTSWTGFLSVCTAPPGFGGLGGPPAPPEFGGPEPAGYALVFRELNDRAEWSTPLPELPAGAYECEVLAGEGSLRVAGGRLEAAIPSAQRFLFARLTRRRAGCRSCR